VKAEGIRSAEPPLLFQIGADPMRWSLLHALSGTDLRVGELCTTVGRPQNLVSYHLRKLRESGLVTSRRSSADARDTYYTLDLPHSAALFAAASAALHPGLAALPPAHHRVPGKRRASVLFVCTGNSSRSQIAEAMFNRSAEDLGHAVSAGSHPKPVHPETARVLAEHGIDARRLRSKHLGEFADGSFDYVVTLCDKVREVCPEFPASPTALHWSIPDPAAAEGETGVRAAFDDVAAELTTRIGFLIKSIQARFQEEAP
jgi:protein-tyrosine-phosphatase/DNA-binding transcriptional ArsR family regulator